MKISAIIMFIISSINLITLILGGGYSGGKVYVESNIQSIIIMSIPVIVLGYLSIKLDWKERVVKCTSCGEVFSETDTQYGNCPKCNGDLIDVKKYYDKSKS